MEAIIPVLSEGHRRFCRLLLGQIVPMPPCLADGPEKIAPGEESPMSDNRETGWCREGGGFETPRHFGIRWSEFGPSLADIAEDASETGKQYTPKGGLTVDPSGLRSSARNRAPSTWDPDLQPVLGGD
jgi:hypothetical protein